MANPVVINPTLTLSGQAAAFNADNTGITLVIDGVSFGRAHYAPNGDETALRDPVGTRVPLAGGSRPNPYQLRTTAVWKENVGQVAVGEIGYWSGDVLVFIWSAADGTVAGYKTDGVTYVLFNDLSFSSVPPGSINFIVDPTESAALAALAAHEGAKNAHPQYMLRADMVKDSGPLAWLGVPSGPVNALTFAMVAVESELAVYAAGQRFQFRAVAQNTGPVTANIEGLGAKSIKKAGDTGLVELEAGDIKPGAVYDLNYDGTGFQLGGGVGGGKAFERFSFTASLAQAEFEFPHVPGSVLCLRNGRETTDFTSAADGSKATLSTAAGIGDSLEFLAFKSFRVADTYTKAEVKALLLTAGSVPVGTMLPFPREAVPPGYLEVDGSLFSAEAYPDLAKYLGGNRLPESRGEFLRGWDHGRGADWLRAIGSLQADTFKAHAHLDMGFVDNVGGGAGASGVTGAAPTPATIFGKVFGNGASATGKGYIENAPGSIGGAAGGLTSGSTGGTETRPRNLAVMWCIKAWNAPINQGQIDIAALAVLASQATETLQGTTKIATQAHVDAGVDDSVTVTPKKMSWGFQALMGINGYIKFPKWLGGLKIQWGQAPSTTTDIDIVFPIAFSGQPFHINVHDTNGRNAAAMTLYQVNAVTPTGFQAMNIGTVTRGSTTLNAPSLAFCPWFAIGI